VDDTLYKVGNQSNKISYTDPSRKYFQRLEDIKEKIEKVKMKKEMQGLENALTILKLEVGRSHVCGEISIDEKKKLEEDITNTEKIIKCKSKEFSTQSTNVYAEENLQSSFIDSSELSREIEKRLMESKDDVVVLGRKDVRKLRKKYRKRFSVFDLMNPAEKAGYLTLSQSGVPEQSTSLQKLPLE
jgi:coenzyme F420-reducing hydrogenase delta subunit